MRFLSAVLRTIVVAAFVASVTLFAVRLAVRSVRPRLNSLAQFDRPTQLIRKPIESTLRGPRAHALDRTP